MCSTFTADVDASIKFYERTLGLRLSDRAADLVAFMHGIHGSDHHMLALVKSSAPGFHHCSWDVASINDIGLGAMRMHDKGWTKGWGLGRHVLGSNYFHYVRDPWGSFAEYSCDIDYIPKEERWPSADHKPEDSFYLWGPDVPPEFTINYEAARAELSSPRKRRTRIAVHYRLTAEFGSRLAPPISGVPGRQITPPRSSPSCPALACRAARGR